jgi:ribosomal protein L32
MSLTKKSLIAENLYRELHASSPPSAPPRPSTASKSKASPPRLLVCYLCGQQFGTASLDIHQPQCYVKCLLRWERGDPDTRGRRPIPPEEHKKMLGDNRPIGGGAKDIDRYNDEMFEQFNNNLSECPNCGRTFLPDRLQVHLKSCKPGNSASPASNRRIAQPSSSVSPSANSASSPFPSQSNANTTGLRPKSAGTSSRSSNRPPPPETGGAYESPSFLKREETNSTAVQSSYSTIQPQYSHHEALDSTQRPDAGNSVNGSALPASLQARLDARRTARNLAKGGGDEDNINKPDQVRSAEERMNYSRTPIKAVEDRSPPPLQQSSPGNQPRRATTPKAGASPNSQPRQTLAQRAAADFQRCQYCNRTFAPDRLAKHEDVCIDKYKKSSPIQTSNNNNNSSVAKRTTTPIKTLSSTTTSSPKTNGGAMQHSTLPTAQFCEECGNKLQTAAKFCSQCGTRL